MNIFEIPVHSQQSIAMFIKPPSPRRKPESSAFQCRLGLDSGFRRNDDLELALPIKTKLTMH
jgi:hypothetical protein